MMESFLSLLRGCNVSSLRKQGGRTATRHRLREVTIQARSIPDRTVNRTNTPVACTKTKRENRH